MTFHLDERRLVVGFTTNLCKVLYRRHSFFRILELGSDPKGSAANKLIVFDVYDPAGYISVDDVQSEIERFRSETKRKVDLHQKVD